MRSAVVSSMFLTACLGLVPHAASAPRTATLSVRPTEQGIAIEYGAMGRFVWEYPTLCAAGDKQTKPVESRVSGNQAVVKYPGDGEIHFTVGADHNVQMEIAKLPAGVNKLRTQMLIDFNYANGGSWKVDDHGEQPFPAEKGRTQIFSDHGRTLTLKNYEGRTLCCTAPPYSFLQLQDNREWGWKIFDWLVFMPVGEGLKRSQWKIAAGGDATAKAQVLVDRFGQSTRVDYPDKVQREEELQADVTAEAEYYAALKPPAGDAYGGLPGSGAQLGLQKTGFFHLEQKRKKWFLVDPAGNAFFHLGVCALSPSDDYTYVEGREGIYAWLPPFEGAFRTAFRENDRHVVSFHLANQIRKYHAPFDLESYVARMIPRLRKWGFNSGGAFSTSTNQAHQAAQFPYVSHLPLAPWLGIKPLPGAEGAWDPFSDRNRRRMEELFAQHLPQRANDPLLIGYFLANEPLYEDLPRAIPALDGKFACKRRLVETLQEKYGSIARFNQAWDAHAGAFEELVERGLAVSTAAAADDVNRFTGQFLDTYYRIVTEAFHRHDPHHLLLGNRFQAGTINNEPLCRICGRYLDLMSFNYYTYHFDTAFLDRIHQWTGGKPMMLTEFYFNSVKDTGLIGGGKQVASQEERGQAYRNYVEHAAASDYIVGIEWFTLVDQSLTGRWFSRYNGENGNTGLVAVSDRPWKPMLAEMMKTNYTIYDVVLGRRAPFVFDNPKFTQAAGGTRTVTIQRALGPITLDGSATHWPGIPAEQIPAGRLVEGNDAGGVEGVFKLCWDDDNLYLLARITDPTPMQNAQRGNMLWSGDGLELFVGHEQLDQPGPLLFSDRQVLLGAGKVDGATHAHVVNQAQQPAIGLVVLPTVDGKGYVLEAAIPFTALGFRPQEGQSLRFDLALDDSENGTARVRQWMWNGTNRNSGDRTHWGRAVLAK